MRRRFRAFAVVVWLAANGSPALANTSGFYDVGPAELQGATGSLIRFERLFDSPFGAVAYRILYRSRGLANEPIAVSGIAIVPSGPAPAGGRNVVAWAHPTTGVARRCAPSLSPFGIEWIPQLERLVAQGYIVTATDYPGLGTPGPHPYLVGVSEGRAVLDSARAVRALPDGHASNRVALWGHSQGGQAV